MSICLFFYSPSEVEKKTALVFLNVKISTSSVQFRSVFRALVKVECYFAAVESHCLTVWYENVVVLQICFCAK